ncbi:hypothetical protein FF124_11265 [Martelella lutilitoris]|uniref:Uncharacterized protein n=1 Tax=Martelella lutilitoris TaxID=2583532 RepID=A0A5C4JPN2_9HYPH|nr:hypothetical protein [Martelella lutilitoris]TNB47435.1 hypothetical protein FF124_11265 [Martelella lutilitoris]
MRSLSAACLLLFTIFVPVQATENWSFADHPHPDFMDEYSAEEDAMIADLEAMGAGINNCSAEIVFEYLIYNRRYPEFAFTHEFKEGLEVWKHHVLETNRAASSFCIVIEVTEELRELYSYDFATPTEGLFCGKPGRPYINAEESRIMGLLDRLVSYAATGNSFALPALSEVEDWSDIRLNPDIRYYVEARQARRYGNEPAPILRDTVIALQGKDRLAFVEDAIARNDLYAVIETSPPCSAFTPEALAKAQEAARGDPI